MHTPFRRLAAAAFVIASLASGGLLVGSAAAAAAADSGPPDGRALPGTGAGTPAKLRAYGRSCAKVGKRSEARVRRSAFAACLDAMARLGSGHTKSPSKACRALSHKRRKGRSGSPYSRCVSAGAKLLRDKRRSEAKRAAGTPADEGATPDEEDGVTSDEDDPAGTGEDDGGDDGFVDGDLDAVLPPVIE